YINTSTTSKIPAKRNARGSNAVPKINPIGPGVVQGKKYIKLFIPKKSTNILNNQTFAIGVNTNGIKNIGFKTRGPPNRIGSLTPKDVGINDALPIALFCLDFAISMNMKGTTKVAPVPPSVATKY